MRKNEIICIKKIDNSEYIKKSLVTKKLLKTIKKQQNKIVKNTDRYQNVEIKNVKTLKNTIKIHYQKYIKK